MKKTIIVWITALMILAQIATAGIFGGDDSDSPVGFDWYEVEDWERTYCQGYAGTDTSQSYYGSTQTATEYPWSVVLVTIQAEKENYTIDGNDTFLYKLSYYIRPGNGSMDFAVRAVCSDCTDQYKQIQGQTTISSTSGMSGYEAWYTNETYTKAQIKYVGSGTGVSSTFTVPFVDEDYEYDDACTGCGSSGGAGTWDDW
ncbi:hypothetical protein K9M79_00215 [Candidatus Woesearchaeota archaeon]|nr:hypothetical protein [Candidatus Woesearchaeota archaeon]